MPLYANALELIRAHLESILRGERVRPVPVGKLTDEQCAAINAHRRSQSVNFEPIVHEVVFVGAHIANSRILRDGYTVADVLEQIKSAMAADSAFVGGGSPMQSLQSIHPRRDRLGNKEIRDQVIFECTSRRPTAELYSVIPKGDKIKPSKSKGHA